MDRGFGLIQRVLLIAAFVPVLALGLMRPTLMASIIFIPLAALAWLSLRLGAVPRWRGAGLLLAAAVCAGVWSLAVVAARAGGAQFVP